MRKVNAFLLAPIILVVFGNISAQSEFFDSESIGRNVKFLGSTGGPTVLLRSDCSTVSGSCITLDFPSGQLQSFDLRDLGSITIPRSGAKSIIRFELVGRWIYELFNPGSQANEGNILYDPYLTIESEVLNDPRALDPVTGLPLNGRFDTNRFTVKGLSRTLASLDRQRDGARSFFVGSISKDALRQRGLPEDLVEEFFKKPVTFRFNLAGRARLVKEGELAYGVRFFGD